MIKTNSLSAWIAATRPYSLVNSLILIMVASSLAWHDGGLRPVVALLCLGFAMLMQTLANLVNDYCDFKKGTDNDERLGPPRAMAQGFITERAMRRGIVLTAVAGCLTGCGLLWFGSWQLIFVGLACLVFACLYTAGPYPLAYHGWGDVAVIVFFGLVPVGFTYGLQTAAWNYRLLLVALACGLAIDTMLMINNYRDREGDRRSGKRTVVVLFGERFGRTAYLVLGFAAVACCLPLAVGGHPFIWVTAAYLPLHVATWRKMTAIGHGRELNVCLGLTARNITLFGLLLTLGILL